MPRLKFFCLWLLLFGAGLLVCAIIPPLTFFLLPPWLVAGAEIGTPLLILLCGALLALLHLVLSFKSARRFARVPHRSFRHRLTPALYAPAAVLLAAIIYEADDGFLRALPADGRMEALVSRIYEGHLTNIVAAIASTPRLKQQCKDAVLVPSRDFTQTITGTMDGTRVALTFDVQSPKCGIRHVTLEELVVQMPDMPTDEDLARLDKNLTLW